MAVQRKLVGIEEFEQFIALPQNDSRRFELIDGEIVEKVPTEEHGIIAAFITAMLLTFVYAHDLGRVAIEPRHGLPDDEHNDYIPDIAFTSKERALPVVKVGAVPQMPDLAVEVKSPNDSLPKMRRKASYYLQNGSRLVWLVFPNLKQVEVHTAEMSVKTLSIGDTLDGGNVIPGFSITLKDIFKE